MSSPQYTPEQLARFQALADQFAQENAAPKAPPTPEEELHAALAELDAEVDGVFNGTVAFGAAQLAKVRDAVRALEQYVTGSKAQA